MFPAVSFHVLHVLFICVVVVSPCFITNCPPGGKRSETEEKTHQCEECGPPGMGGRCYGPQTCCSSQFGCLIGSSVTGACQQETRSPSLCHNPAQSCDGSAETGLINGQCAALGICCTPETCTVDEDCTSGSLADASSVKGHMNMNHVLQQAVDDPENMIAVPVQGPVGVRGPLDAWFYRRVLQHRGKLQNEPEVAVLASSVVPQGPPFSPPGPARLADYF